RKRLKDVDWLLLLAPIALTLLGCLGIFSTGGADFLKKQLIALAIGVVIAVVVMFTDYRKIIMTVAPFFFAAVMVLLVLVLIVGIERNGNKAWLNLAGFSFQPSEFAKVATILMLARYMSHPRDGSLSIKDMVVMALIAAPSVILIFLENDTGTMLTFGAILGAFYFVGGMRKLFMVAALVAVVGGLVAVYPHLKEYQKQRIDVILHPETADPRGYGYQTIQSVIAVGSGGLLGKGVGQGTQGKLGFLPYAYSDFIGAVVAEESGFVGILLMMVLYLLLIWRMFAVAANSRDRAGALMVIGFIALMAFHILCNLGMVVGLLPIMGIPLPLMSAGGTAIMATFLCVGLALSVRLRRFVN
ncbi:MAG TPA: FtsW/RodA/SpoVE family cell cycle protein, partial [Blastocatellia bacterium]|nr:FtsW/RodA/SpoVE family cell cycle protein [Blastocatellia bacterium]